MARAEVRPATVEDIRLITPRRADIEECWAGFHQTPDEAMRFGIEHGRACIGFIDDLPAGIFGVVPQGRVGVPWALFTDVVEQRPKAFLNACRVPLQAIRENFDYLVNYVDARNYRAISWLRWLGFTVYPATPFGVDQLPFHKFDWHVQS